MQPEPVRLLQQIGSDDPAVPPTPERRQRLRGAIGHDNRRDGLAVEHSSVAHEDDLVSRVAILEAVSYAARRFLGGAPWERHAPEFLARLGEATGVSRVYVFQIRPSVEDEVVVDLRFEWVAPGVEELGTSRNGFRLQAGGFGRWVEHFRARRVIAGPVHSLPPDERARFLAAGIQSVLAVPIFAGEEWWGIIGFDEQCAPRAWPASVVDAVTTAAGVIGAAIRSQRDAAALEERERQYRSVVNTIREVIFQTDLRGHFTLLNPAWTTLTGYSVDESLGRNMHEFVIGHDGTGPKETIRAIVEARQLEARLPLRLRTKEGGACWVDAYLRGATGEDGTLVGLAGTLRDSSERRAAEEALRASERYFRSLTDHAMDLTLIVGPDGAIGYASRAIEGLLGYQPAEVIGTPALQLVHPEDRAAAERLLRRVAAEPQGSGRIAFRIRTRAGEDRTLEAVVTNLLHDETVAGLVINARDITERVAAEVELRRRTDALAALHESALDLLNRRNVDDVLRAIVDRAGALFATQDGFIHLIAPTRDHLVMRIGTGVFEPIQGRTISLNEGVAGRVWATGKPFLVNDYENWEGALHHSRRVEVFDSLVGIPLMSENELVGVLGLAQRPGKPGFSETDVEILSLFGQLASIVLDNVRLYAQAQEEIEERKQAAEALRQSEQRNRALLDAIPDLMLRISSEGDFLDYHPGTAEAQSAPREWVVGRTLWDNFSAERANLFLQCVRRAIATGEPQTLEFSFQAGNRLLEREARFVRSGDREALVLVRDITERKKVDLLKNEFVSTVSHELRTPLTSIRGSLGLLKGGVGGALPPEAANLVDIAFKNSERLVRLINDILDIEKIESGKLPLERRPLDLGHLVESAIEANEGLAAELGVRLTIGERTTPAIVLGDYDRLMQVMANLLSNAAKFSPAGAEVRVDVTRSRGGFRVAVRDQGPGIPDQFRSRVFERFAQADSSDRRQKGGTGLGLSITKAIVERHGGTIGFETSESGSTFWFELADASNLPPRDDPRPEPSDPVLICAHDPDIANVLRFLLQAAGFQVHTAQSAEHARRLLKQRRYLAMTLDLSLPDSDGVSLIRQLRADPATADLPIVVVSVAPERGRDDLNGEAVEIFDWVDTPLDRERLVAAVRMAALRARERRPRVLHVEDDPDIRAIVAQVIDGTATTVAADGIAAARERLRESSFDLVILDLALPDGSGLTLLPEIAETPAAPPVLVFSAEEVAPDLSSRIAAALVKARTSNDQLLTTIRGLIARSSRARP
ncbi:MAG: hybrid sensor histidine kinase/response regulator [Dehalococcoidia bacterium]|nr:MAG: hybrid sensor histidine kinase/response regulator [Dehalococcoidia bacterium]